MKIDNSISPVVIRYKCLRCGTSDRKTKRGMHKDVRSWYCEDTFMCEWDAWGKDEKNAELDAVRAELKVKQARFHQETRKIFGVDQTRDYYHYSSDAFDLLPQQESVFDWYKRIQGEFKAGPHLKLKGGDND